MAVSDKKRSKITAELDPVLMTGETVEVATTALAHVKRMGTKTVRSGTFFITDRRCGVFTKKLGGHDLTDLALNQITSVQHKVGLTSGEITIESANSTLYVRQIKKDEIDGITQLLRDRVHSGPTPDASPATAPSSMDELGKLVEFHRQGILTDAEFAAQKAKLLG